MSKTLILYQGKDSYFFPFQKSDNYSIENYYTKNTGIVFRLLRKINSPLLKFYYESWKYQLSDYDDVILFDNGYNKAVAKFIRRKNKKIRIHLYFWNTIYPYTEKFIERKLFDSISTFELKDANKYELEFIDTFYSSNVKLEKSNTKDNLVFFLGRNKARSDKLAKLENEFSNIGVNTKFIIIKSESDFINYSEYLEYLTNANCILEIPQKGQSGLSLRAMESIFLRKKLITTNYEITNHAIFNKNNCFYIEEDFSNIVDIPKFLDLPFQEIDTENYSFENWLKKAKGGEKK